ncbi:hypothetical protein WICPIJ_005904 [Wickerhamomyces pijperi]|uniref:Cns1/TTC4 wheel domain-containing protein n=1 Tax=Wickerhamomyces pijperi TaxID=599730 RepID=A0A9P8TLW5_WICPI|nr:hypothetical protein WICPIJ_005904 [Wickerhamomyces pijperi]
MSEEQPKQFEKPKRYVPGPGDPSLPPQLTQLSSKTVDDVMEELNRSPFFMTKLDESDGDGGSNLELEALKALAYDGEPDEIALNFKNQGNGQYKIKLYKSAIEFYDKGIAVKCGVADLDASLFLNRAACNLELKNYRRCINDCKQSLTFDPKNIKAYYRMARAFSALEKFEEAKEALEFGLKFDAENKASLDLLTKISKREEEIKAIAEKKEQERQTKERIATNLQTAIQLRNYTNINTKNPADLLKDSPIHLEDPEDIESQLILPATIIYPSTSEFDFIATISELTTAEEIIEMVLDRPQEWHEDPKHKNFTLKEMQAYMESESGGLIKIGKKATLMKALATPKPIIPLLDNSIRLYLIPKVDAESWLGTWDKAVAIKRRTGAM